MSGLTSAGHSERVTERTLCRAVAPIRWVVMAGAPMLSGI